MSETTTPPRCPECGSTNVGPFSKTLAKQRPRDKTVRIHRWICRECSHQWSDESRDPRRPG